MTQEIKEEVIYSNLEQNKEIPPIEEILQMYGSVKDGEDEDSNEV